MRAHFEIFVPKETRVKSIAVSQEKRRWVVRIDGSWACEAPSYQAGVSQAIYAAECEMGFCNGND